MQAVKNRIIKWLGGYTRKEYADVSHKLLVLQVEVSAAAAMAMGIVNEEILASLDMLSGGYVRPK